MSMAKKIRGVLKFGKKKTKKKHVPTEKERQDLYQKFLMDITAPYARRRKKSKNLYQ